MQQFHKLQYPYISTTLNECKNPYSVLQTKPGVSLSVIYQHQIYMWVWTTIRGELKGVS